MLEEIERDHLIPFHLVFGKEARKVYDEIASIFKINTLAHWMNIFQDVDCCISPVLPLNESLNNEQVQARNMVVNHNHTSDGNVIQFALPIKSSGFNFKIRKPAPLLGEDTEKILISAGYTKKEIDDFRTKNIIK